MVLSARSKRDRGIVGVIGVLTVAVTLAYVRSWFGFGYGILTGAGMILVAWKLPAWVSDALLKVLGVVSCLYAVWDIGSDLIARSVPGSDANALAELTGIPGVVWGVLWAVAAVGIAAVALWIAARGSDRDEDSPPAE